MSITEGKRHNIFVKLHEIIWTIEFLCEKNALERDIEIKQDENSDYFPYNAKYRILQTLEIYAITDLFTKLHNVYDSGRNSKSSLDKCALDENSDIHNLLEEYADLIGTIKENRNKLIAHEDFVQNIESELVFEETGWDKPFDKIPRTKIKDGSINKNLQEFRVKNGVDLAAVIRLVHETLDILGKEWKGIYGSIEKVYNPFEGFIQVLTEDLLGG